MTYHYAVVEAYRNFAKYKVAMCVANSRYDNFFSYEIDIQAGVYRDNLPPGVTRMDPNPTPISMQEINEALAIVAGSTA